MRKVEVTLYNKDWPLMFEEEAEKLRKIFGSEIIGIYHIGSTSVAKPVIDIMPVVKDVNRLLFLGILNVTQLPPFTCFPMYSICPK